MNLNDYPTQEQLAALMAEQNDEAGEHMLWVDVCGQVRVALAEASCGYQLPNARLVYAPFESGVGFVGEGAAADSELLAELMESLAEQWRAAAGASPGEIIIDLDDPGSVPRWTFAQSVTVADDLHTDKASPSKR